MPVRDLPRPQDTPCTQQFVEFEQTSSDPNWAQPACAAPRMCMASTGGECAAMKAEPASPEDKKGEYICMAHQTDLNLGEQDADTFRCASGMCIDITGRCNGHPNC